jgi:hypothetical protein
MGSITNYGFDVQDQEEEEEEEKEEVELMIEIRVRKRGRRSRCWLLVRFLAWPPAPGCAAESSGASGMGLAIERHSANPEIYAPDVLVQYNHHTQERSQECCTITYELLRQISERSGSIVSLLKS